MKAIDTQIQEVCQIPTMTNAKENALKSLQNKSVRGPGKSPKSSSSEKPHYLQ
jgi:hypothetical protein